MTWEEVHEEIIRRLLEGHFDMPHGCGMKRTCIWIIKATKPHVSFVKGIVEVSQWYDNLNGVKISLADPDFFEKIEKEVWQTDL